MTTQHHKYLILVLALLSSNLVKAEGTILRGFGESRLYFNHENSAGAFQFGPFDVFLSSQIDKKTSYLMEVVFEGDDKTGEMKLDLERMFIQYEVNPLLKIAFGRFHTALGYWNETFHHGSYLSVSASRPVFLRFEDEGGLLPVHTVGLEIRGNKSNSDGNLGYQVNYGNGRGPANDPPQNFRDRDNKKSISGVLYYEKNGKRYGANAYFDTIPSTGTGSATDFGGKESITGLHFVWINPAFEWLTEYMMINHSFNNNPSTTGAKTIAFYSQIGIILDHLTPYVRIENNSPDKNDPYLNISNDTWYNTLGIRYDLSSASALKAEVEEKREKTKEPTYVSQINWSFAW